MTKHKEKTKTQTDNDKKMTDKEKQHLLDKMSSGGFEVLKPKDKK
ncbi:MAG: hypothetical protein PHH59_07835 [Methylovulum sp.]|nr:hypothetical protein [Methylovulum sp.]MDD2723916.1 hypothetical protein [Methylovulum sp.]MDD5125245.1 hypothetical protein [Methylovulum sp.]